MNLHDKLSAQDTSAFLSSGAIMAADSSEIFVGFGPRIWLSEPRSFSFYFPDFFLRSKTPWFRHESVVKMSISGLEEALCGFEAGYFKSREWIKDSKSSFESIFEDLQADFNSGKLLKAVPYTCERSHLGVDQNQLIYSLKRILGAAKRELVFPYGFWDRQEGLLGATPEKLFSLDSKSLKTCACAGTRRRGPDEELIGKDPKELYEHELVVRGIFESLGPYGAVVAKERTIRKFKNLVHLITPITLTLTQEQAFEDIVRAMHPTPALGAYPKESGLQWLESFDKNLIQRDFFGAPVGYHFDGAGECLVAIRNMQWGLNETRLMAGCGVVQRSVMQNEWEELLLKLTAIKDLLGL